MSAKYIIHPMTKKFIKDTTGLDFDAPSKMTEEDFQRALGNKPTMTIDALYKDLLQRLGCNGHDGAIEEIKRLREASAKIPLNEEIT